MLSLGDDWLFEDTRIYHACGPDLTRHWTGGCVCKCGSPVPQRVQSFHHWLGEQERRSQEEARHKAEPRHTWVIGTA
jgi:hypothetical protein